MNNEYIRQYLQSWSLCSACLSLVCHCTV